MNLPSSPTDPLDVMIEQALAAIRRHHAEMIARIRLWQPRECPPDWQPVRTPNPRRQGWAR